MLEFVHAIEADLGGGSLRGEDGVYRYDGIEFRARCGRDAG